MCTSMQKEEKQMYWIEESIKDKPFDETYTINKELGSGATSKVFKCVHNGTGDPWAVKIIKKEVDKKVIRTEIGVLLKIKHDNVIRMKEIYETATEIYLVLELVTGGELFERIVNRGQYTEKDAALAVREMLTAVKYLHENGVIHRDLKPENLLYENLSPNAKLKVADFGLSKIVSAQVLTNTVCGTPGYCAPEVVRGQMYNGSVDLWSIGVIAYILLCGYEPFYDDDHRVMYKKIIKGSFEFDMPYWKNITENAKDLIRKLLRVDVRERITVDQALKHIWVSGAAASGEHMEETQTNIKKFNARRKMKHREMFPEFYANEELETVEEQKTPEATLQNGTVEHAEETTTEAQEPAEPVVPEKEAEKEPTPTPNAEETTEAKENAENGDQSQEPTDKTDENVKIEDPEKPEQPKQVEEAKKEDEAEKAEEVEAAPVEAAGTEDTNTDKPVEDKE